MIALDTNVLIHAHRAEMPRHKESAGVLRRLAEGNVPWGLPVFVIGEFIRVTTHPHVLKPPSTIKQACDALDALLSSPTCRLLVPGVRFATLLAKLCRDHDLLGNRVFDAQIAAVCLEQGITELMTFDRDFDRIHELRVIKPDR